MPYVEIKNTGLKYLRLTALIFLIYNSKNIFLNERMESKFMEYISLAEKAVEAKAVSFPPYSNFHVGAAH